MQFGWPGYASDATQLLLYGHDEAHHAGGGPLVDLVRVLPRLLEIDLLEDMAALVAADQSLWSQVLAQARLCSPPALKRAFEVLLQP